MTAATALANLSKLPLARLKHACFLAGLATSGSKAPLSTSLLATLEARQTQDEMRILSIDMGIRNLGICSLTSPRPSSSPANTLNLQINTWHKIDLEPLLQPLDPTIPVTPATLFTPPYLSMLATTLTRDFLVAYNPTHILIERQRFRSGGASAVQEWTLRVNMLESMLWAGFRCRQDTAPPTTAFPSLHAIPPPRVAGFWCGLPPGSRDRGPLLVASEALLELPTGKKIAQRKTKDGEPEVDADDAAAKVAAAAKVIDKKAKIGVVRHWLSRFVLSDTGGSVSTVEDDLSLDFSQSAAETAKLFTAGNWDSLGGGGEATARVKAATRKASRRKKGNPEVEVADLRELEASHSSVSSSTTSRAAGKLDDLADCLLQATAFVRWEANRNILARSLEKFNEK